MTHHHHWDIWPLPKAYRWCIFLLLLWSNESLLDHSSDSHDASHSSSSSSSCNGKASDFKLVGYPYFLLLLCLSTNELWSVLWGLSTTSEPKKGLLYILNFYPLKCDWAVCCFSNSSFEIMDEWYVMIGQIYWWMNEWMMMTGGGDRGMDDIVMGLWAVAWW